MQCLFAISIFMLLIGLYMTVSSIILYKSAYINLLYSKLVSSGMVYVRVTMLDDTKEGKSKDYFGWSRKNDVISFNTTYKEKGVWMFRIINEGNEAIPVDKIDFFTELGSAKLINKYGGFKKSILSKLSIS